MAGPVAYDELGRILSEGGIRAARYGLTQVGPGILLVNWLVKRFPSLSRIQAGTLAAQVNAYAGAGQALSQQTPSVPIDPATVPVIPQHALGGAPGPRYFADTKVTFVDPNTGAVRVMTVGFTADLGPSLQEVVDAAETVARAELFIYAVGQGAFDPLSAIVTDISIEGVLRIY